MKSRKVTFDLDFETEGGRIVKNPSIYFHQFGTPNHDGSNVVWVCHALTANSNVFDWWPGLFGNQAYFNPDDWCIICPNIFGSCYGSFGPLERNSETGKPWYGTFPQLTIRDIVKGHRLLADYLGLTRIKLLIGASLGGQQALEWSVSCPHLFEQLAVLATNAIHSSWGVGLNETQRMAIETDPSWGEANPRAGYAGLKVARAIGLHSYRNYDAYCKSQPRNLGENSQEIRVKSYQRYQGEKLANRFNAVSYYRLTEAMDSHDLGRGRNSLESTLGNIRARTLIVSMENDLLFPEREQQLLAAHIQEAQYAKVATKYGHDGFLLEIEQLSRLLRNFIGVGRPA